MITIAIVQRSAVFITFNQCKHRIYLYREEEGDVSMHDKKLYVNMRNIYTYLAFTFIERRMLACMIKGYMLSVECYFVILNSKSRNVNFNAFKAFV